MSDALEPPSEARPPAPEGLDERLAATMRAIGTPSPTERLEPPSDSRLEHLDPAIGHVPVEVFNRLVDVVNALADVVGWEWIDDAE